MFEGLDKYFRAVRDINTIASNLKRDATYLSGGKKIYTRDEATVNSLKTKLNDDIADIKGFYSTFFGKIFQIFTFISDPVAKAERIRDQTLKVHQN